MKINKPAIYELIKYKFRNNQKWFAEELKIDNTYFNAILRGRKSDESNKVCNAIIKYCLKNNLNVKKFIFLE